MRAVQITSLDGPSAVRPTDVDDVVPDAEQVLIRVRAAGVSFPEVLQTRGLYQLKPPLPFVPGSEVAGEVVSAPEASRLRAGDRVAAFPMLGGFAELAVAHDSMTFPLPDDVSFEVGAALPLNYLTAYFALVERGRLAEGETVLVHGAAGGVGTASIQVAKAFGAGRVIAVTSTDAKADVARAAGADDVAGVDGFKDAVKALPGGGAGPRAAGGPGGGAGPRAAGGPGVDVVVDPVGGDRFTDSLRSLNDDGRLLVIGFTAGEIPTVQVNRLLLNNVSVVGVGWGAYALKRPGHIAREWDAIAPHVASGALRPPIGATFPLDRAADALAEIDERRATGKVLLLP